MTTTVFGRTIFTDLAEIANPSHTAVLVIDPQNDFLDPRGIAAEQGIDVKLLRQPIPMLRAFLDEARTFSPLIVYLQYTQDPFGRYPSDADLSRLVRDSHGEVPNWAVEGTWGHDFVPELKPERDDIVVRKHRASGFSQTDLDLILRTNGIRTVVIVGITTSGCVMYTARDAMMHDYYVVILTDCIGSRRQDWHEATVLVMNRLFHYVGPASGLLEEWEALRERDEAHKGSV